jgi:hypothetical protein
LVLIGYGSAINPAREALTVLMTRKTERNGLHIGYGSAINPAREALTVFETRKTEREREKWIAYRLWKRDKLSEMIGIANR